MDSFARRFHVVEALQQFNDFNMVFTSVGIMFFLIFAHKRALVFQKLKVQLQCPISKKKLENYNVPKLHPHTSTKKVEK
jgi:hypothetical protein